MSKFLLIFLVQISKALVNSKIQFLTQKSFFFTFGPATFTGPLGLWPSRPAGLSSTAGQSPQGGPSRSALQRRWRNCRSTLSPLIHAFRSQGLLSTHR
jgi:hypothetical protein